MKTRKIYLASLLLAATMATACEEWLKIEPEYEITDTDLYKNTAGYYKVVNGLYRHGFLIAPALAELTLAYVEHGQIDNEVMQCL